MDFDVLGYTVMAGHLVELLVAYFLAFPVAWNRERSGRSAGLRTFPLVATASCAYVLVGREVLADDPQAMARVLYGLMTGIGFIGGGAIVKERGIAHGTATAASIWGTGAIGAAVAYGRYEIAVFVALLTFLTLFLFRPLKGRFSTTRGPSRRDASPERDEETDL